MELNHFLANFHQNLHEGINQKKEKRKKKFNILFELFRKSIRESATTSGTSGSPMGNNMAGSTASASSSTSSYRRPADLNNTSMTTSTAGPTTNDNLAVGGVPGDIKPRSLRFTWSMKTTSSMDPADMMKEIRKVKILLEN